MKQESAEILAAEALAWLAGRDDLLTIFMGATGVSADDLRARAGEAEFLASVLDFLLMDDAWVLGFCQDTGRPAQEPMRARAALPGGAQMHWT